MNLKEYIKKHQARVNEELKNYVNSYGKFPKTIFDSMNYSLEAGGKRVRPILAIAACEACGGNAEKAMPVACALEMIHTFSLIHDDLPAMDDDDYRRGKLTNHKVYGEAVAVLAGDGLMTLAFSILSNPDFVNSITPKAAIEIIADISKATGVLGMIGGQVIDMESQGKKITINELETLHNLKTGELITISVTSGAKVAGATSEQVEAIRKYGEATGLSFQVADDILDIVSTTEELGKDVGSDVENEKATFPALIGLEASRERANKLMNEAIEYLSVFDEKADPLREIARYIVERTN
ncbi:polyprenyl synthetase family protein [bacterium]|nr:polyprenyl synthetase family protein [bacterium]